jgi:ferric-dicitrate binding protein FerR (iron transport regulator)
MTATCPAPSDALRRRARVRETCKRVARALARLLGGLLVAAPLAGQTTWADDTIHIRTANGKQRAEFTLSGDNHCVLEDDAIVCVRVSK